MKNIIFNWQYRNGIHQFINLPGIHCRPFFGNTILRSIFFKRSTFLNCLRQIWPFWQMYTFRFRYSVKIELENRPFRNRSTFIKCHQNHQYSFLELTTSFEYKIQFERDNAWTKFSATIIWRYSRKSNFFIRHLRSYKIMNTHIKQCKYSFSAHVSPLWQDFKTCVVEQGTNENFLWSPPGTKRDMERQS